VPSIGLAAYNAAAAKINPKLNATVLVFISASSGHFSKKVNPFLLNPGGRIISRNGMSQPCVCAAIGRYRTLVLSTLLIFLDSFAQ
jgi:hypothetical protein